MKAVHLFASRPQFARHLMPIWRALHPSARGELLAGVDARWQNVPDGGLVIVAGFGDVERCAKHPVVYVEHGAGQAYHGDPKAKARTHYHGSQHPDNVIGYVCPNDAVAGSWGRPAVAVGCPALDWHHDEMASYRFGASQPTVAITFHWDCKVCPESRSALQWYFDSMPAIIEWVRRQGFEVLGHEHPRWQGRVLRMWQRLGVEVEPDPDEVLRRADVMIADNTSLAIEFASLDRPIIWLNAPWYRRDVWHGGRFWRWTAAGPVVDGAVELMTLDLVADVIESETWRAGRRMIVDEVYAYTDGLASARAARFVHQLLAEM